MLTLIAVFLAALIGGALYRARGGGIATGSTQINRLAFWVAPCTLLAVAALWPIGPAAWFLLPAFVLATWGVTAAGHAVGMVFEYDHLGDGHPGHWAPKDGKWFDTFSEYPLRWIFGAYDTFWRIRKKYRYMAVAGAVTGFVRGLPWILLGFWWMPVLSAVAWPAAYWCSWQYVGYRWRFGRFLSGQTEWGEFWYGAAVFAGAALGFFFYR